MKQAAAVATRSGRTLLVLDTRSGDPIRVALHASRVHNGGRNPRLRPQRLWAAPRHHDHVQASAPDHHKAAGLRRLRSSLSILSASAEPLENAGN